MLRQLRGLAPLLLVAGLLVAGRSTGRAAQFPPAPPAPTVRSERSLHMQDHFATVAEIQSAVIRGDLESAREPARWFADHVEEAGGDARAQPFVARMREHARAAASATDIAAAAREVAAMGATCGGCHVALETRAASPSPRDARLYPDGVVGHMLEHQLAIAQLYDGLVEPSDAAWREGARALGAAPLQRQKFPRDAKLTGEVLAAEGRVHALSERAVAATDEAARVQSYADVITTCAECHGLHGRVWGPGLPR